MTQRMALFVSLILAWACPSLFSGWLVIWPTALPWLITTAWLFVSQGLSRVLFWWYAVNAGLVGCSLLLNLVALVVPIRYSSMDMAAGLMVSSSMVTLLLLAWRNVRTWQRFTLAILTAAVAYSVPIAFQLQLGRSGKPPLWGTSYDELGCAIATVLTFATVGVVVVVWEDRGPGLLKQVGRGT